MTNDKNKSANTVPAVSYRDTLKSADTEEHIDLAFYRPIGYMWACLAARLGIKPNAITIASIFLGIAAGIAFYFNNLWVNIAGMLLLVWANSFDSADGQLARMTKQYSRLGRILDGMAGDLWFATIYVAICLRENVTSDFFMSHPWLIWVIAVITGICHAKQAAMADYYRQFHLYFLKGEDGSELDSSENLEKRCADTPWRGHFWSKLTQLVYLNYTRNQEVMTPQMQRMRRLIAARWPKQMPEALRANFRAASLPLMKYTNILSFNWRCIALFAALFARMPWLYFAFELVVLNALLVYMVLRHESICRRFCSEIEAGKYN